ncbi:MAG: hypothetical protein ABFS16_00155 [Bacteroidota bacterium]
MKQLLVFFLVLSSISVYSQGFITSKNVKVQLSGFVRNDFIYDSRKNKDAVDHLLERWPLRPEYDANGDDLNAQSSLHMLNTFTRFGTRFSGLEIGKARIGAYVEVDFTGGSATNSLRFRHAYTKFDWEKSHLLFGRTWHPTFIEKVFPSTLNENTGMPFQVFNRSPQLRFTHSLTSNIDVILAAVYQFKYANFGPNEPNGKTYMYQRNAGLPNLHAQLQFYNENWVVGALIDWKTIQPRTSTTGYNGIFKTTEKLSSVAAIAYIKYAKDMFTFKAKSTYGQNLSESLLPGGYAIASYDAATGTETYTPTNHIYNWVNFTYGKKWVVGLYAGHLKYLGLSENQVGQTFYGEAADVDVMWKVAPQLIYNYKNFMFGWELTWTTAKYGDIDYNDKSKVTDAEGVTNFRNLVSVAYKF